MSAPASIDFELALKEYLDEKLSIREIATRHGYSPVSLWRRFKAANVSLDRGRQFGGRKGTGKYPQLGDRVWLAKQLKTRTTIEIANELGTTPGNVSDFISRHGLHEGLSRSEVIKAGIAKKAPTRTYASGKDHSQWNGGWYLTQAGYVKLHQPDHSEADNRGYVLEHRLVMEKRLGRLLKEDEVVHHINGIKKDNRDENLELFENQEEHMQLHNTVRTFVRKVKALQDEIAVLKAENEALKRAH